MQARARARFALLQTSATAHRHGIGTGGGIRHQLSRPAGRHTGRCPTLQATLSLGLIVHACPPSAPLGRRCRRAIGRLGRGWQLGGWRPTHPPDRSFVPVTFVVAGAAWCASPTRQQAQPVSAASDSLAPARAPSLHGCYRGPARDAAPSFPEKRWRWPAPCAAPGLDL